MATKQQPRSKQPAPPRKIDMLAEVDRIRADYEERLEAEKARLREEIRAEVRAELEAEQRERRRKAEERDRAEAEQEARYAEQMRRKAVRERRRREEDRRRHANVVNLYAAIGVHGIAGGRVRCIAPRPSGVHEPSSARREPTMTVDLNTGTYWCECGARGGPYDAAIVLGRGHDEAVRLLRRYHFTEEAKRRERRQEKADEVRAWLAGADRSNPLFGEISALSRHDLEAAHKLLPKQEEGTPA
jgi:hypothetical protein